jgi:hypothetical protein
MRRDADPLSAAASPAPGIAIDLQAIRTKRPHSAARTGPSPLRRFALPRRLPATPSNGRYVHDERKQPAILGFSRPDTRRLCHPTEQRIFSNCGARLCADLALGAERAGQNGDTAGTA